MQTKIRIYEVTVMTAAKYGSETRALQKAYENLLGVFQRNRIWIVPGTQMIDHISNSRLYKKMWFNVKERLTRIEQVLRMKDDRLPKIVVFDELSRAKRKAGHPQWRWEDVIKKN